MTASNRINIKSKLLTNINHFKLMIKTLSININSILLFEVIHKVIGLFILLPILNLLIHFSLHIHSLAYLDLNALKTYIYSPPSLFFVIIATLLFIVWMGFEYIFLVSCFMDNGLPFNSVLQKSKENVSYLWKQSKGNLIKTMLAYFIVFTIIYLVTVHSNFTLFTLAFNFIKQNVVIAWSVFFITVFFLWWIARWLYLIEEITEDSILSHNEQKKWHRKTSIQTILFCLLILLFFSLLFFCLNLLTTLIVYCIRHQIYYPTIIGVKTIVRSFYSGIVFILVPPLLLCFMSTYSRSILQSENDGYKLQRHNSISKVTLISVILFLVTYVSTLFYDTHDFFTFVPKELRQPLAIAHRGTSLWAPGNSLASITDAIDDEADYIELDVQVSADGIPVLFHDAYLNSLNTNSPDYNLNRLRINEVNYSELQQLTLNTYFPDSYKEKIISLNDALTIINSKAGLMLEIKTKNEDEINIILNTLLQSGFDSPLYISSFDINTLEFFKNSALTCETNLLLTGFVGEIDNILKNPAIDAMAFEYAAINSLLVEQIHTANKKIFVWTINEEDKMVRTIFDGVDGIITDDPNVVKHNFYHVRKSEFNQLFDVIAK